MKAAVFDGKEILVQDLPKPDPSKTQALIHVRACGLCGTDIAIIQGHLYAAYPLILGHELAGEVVKIGNRVEKSWLGKRVTVEINSNVCTDKALACYYCKQQIPTHCINRRALGIGIDGGFAEYLCVEASLLHEIPDSLSYLHATFIEPLAAAYQTFEMMPLDSRDQILALFGLGKLGLLVLQVARLRGLEIIAVGGGEKKRTLAKKFGAKSVINRYEDLKIPYSIKKLTNELGADIVIDTTGNPQALEDIVASCRSRGKIHMKSTHGVPVSLNTTDLVVREITLYTSRCGSFQQAIESLSLNNIRVKELISGKYPLDDIQNTITTIMNDPNYIKAIFIP